MAAEQEQSPNLLDFNNKQENNGTNNRGRLTAHESVSYTHLRAHET